MSQEERKVLEQRIGFLMMALQLPSDVREAWLKVLSTLGDTEAEQVGQVLEREYLAAVTKPVDDELTADLNRLSQINSEA